MFYFSLCYPCYPDNECVETAKKIPRKIEDECRTFNTEWTYKYFITNFGSKAGCLICQECVAVFKEHNLKRHFQTKHGNFGSNLSESKLQQKANDMVKSLKQQQTFFCKTNSYKRPPQKLVSCLLINMSNITNRFLTRNL